MLDTLLAARFGIARAMSLIIAVGASTYLSVFCGWVWWQWSLVGIAALLFVPILWGIFLGILEKRRMRKEGWPI